MTTTRLEWTTCTIQQHSVGLPTTISEKCYATVLLGKAERGAPKCVLQVEQQSADDQRAVRGTVKAAVLIGDPDCPNLVASSVYDSKPVHYLSMVSPSIKWIVKEKRMYTMWTLMK